MGKYRCLFDTDVLINWLAEEDDLWKAPMDLIKLHEEKEIDIFISLLSFLELRFVFRRKKKIEDDVIDDMIIDMPSNFNISVPSSATLLKANELQSSHHFDPFDAILLALAETINIDVLVTRNKEFRELGQKYILIKDPEETLAMVMDENGLL
jgi:predicted nucleic acid-binding protein